MFGINRDPSDPQPAPADATPEPTTPVADAAAPLRVVLREGQAGRGNALGALFADWPAPERGRALETLAQTFGDRAGAVVLVTREQQHVELCDLATGARARLRIPVGL